MKQQTHRTTSGFNPLKQQLATFKSLPSLNNAPMALSITPQDPLTASAALEDTATTHSRRTCNTQFDIAEVVGWQSPQHENCLLLRHESAPKAFFCGGFSPLQREQLPHLMAEMIGLKVAFSYEGEDPNNAGCPNNPKFMTLLAGDCTLKLAHFEDRLNRLSEGSL